MKTKEKMEKIIRNKKGITLIALVVTIVVLLILAGVSINLVVGNNGIINQSIEASKKTDIAGTRERIDLELVGRYDNKGNYTNDDVIQAVLEVTGQEIEEGTETITTAKGNEVDISDLWVIIEKISTEESYLGYYADFEGDGTIEGIIYADLAVGGSGTWNGDSYSSYSYEVQTGLKDYYVSATSYEGAFGTKDVLSPTGTGNDRFYVMALEDVDSNYHYWYYSASGNLDSSYSVSSSTNDFGEGKANTIRMVNAWNNSTYGSQNGGTTYNPDLWGLIQDSSSCSYDIVTSASDSCKWFVPSKAEWVAFEDYVFTYEGVTTSNYGNYSLSRYYWSSSQGNNGVAYHADAKCGYIGRGDVSYYECVRLSATF